MAPGVTSESGLDEKDPYVGTGWHVAEGDADVPSMAGSILDVLPDVSVGVTVEGVLVVGRVLYTDRAYDTDEVDCSAM